MENATYTESTYQSNDQLRLAENFVRFTDRHIFLTGKAGTGKTTFLHRLKTILHKRLIIVAPTGVAAINAGGVTIHSFFQLAFGPHIPSGVSNDLRREKKHVRKFSREKQNIIRSLDLLIIDEISMVRADVLDAIDEVLRKYRHRDHPFGGVQLLMIGDIHQLAPVVKDQDRHILKDYYNAYFFFGSRVLSQVGFITIELNKVFRQKDEYFIGLLNKIRDSQADVAVFEELNKRYQPDFSPVEDEGYITLCTHNRQAQVINDEKMNALKTPAQTFEAKIDGIFPENIWPVAQKLLLKKDAQVMFLKNDPSPEKLFYNGKTGYIVDFDDEIIKVKCPGESDILYVGQQVWNNYNYNLNAKSKEIEEEVIGSFTQFPLKPAWAITIHKSQGLTFDKAIIDAQKAFAYGQVYVALSRCRSIEGLVLSSKISTSTMVSDRTVDQFAKNAYDNPPTEEELSEARTAYRQKLLNELFGCQNLSVQMQEILRQVTKYEAAITGNLKGQVTSICEHVHERIVMVANKFGSQLRMLLKDDRSVKLNEQIQGRIKKATAYFIPHLNEFSSDLKAISVETDNSEIRNSIEKIMDVVEKDIHIKLACLKASQKGFSMEAYQKARAISAIEGPGKKAKQTSNVNVALEDLEHRALYEDLKIWRQEVYIEKDIAHYRILNQKSLMGIVQLLPRDKTALRTIQGIGKRKVEKYGDQILDVINHYCEKHNIPIDYIPSAEKKAIKIPSRSITKKMFDEGVAIKDIAKERGFVETTIEGHLGHYVGTGDLDLYQFVSPKKTEVIKRKLKKLAGQSTSAIKESLGLKYSYSDIRFVLKHLEYLENSELTSTSKTE